MLILRNPTVTVQRDGEEAMEVSPKRIAKQWAATYGQSVPNPSRSNPSVASLAYAWDDPILQGLSDMGIVRATLREETYKKSKKTGTEKLRCKLGLDDLDAELVDDLVGLPGPVPCTLEFRTPCDDGELD